MDWDRLSRAALAFLGLFLAAAAVAQKSPRSIEVLRSSCASGLGRHEVTLFMNGTVRLREGRWEDEVLYLDELTPEALEDNLRLLRTVHSDYDVDHLSQPMPGARGRGMEHCEVVLALPGQEVFEYRYSSYDVPPLKVARLVQIADELAQYTRPLEAPADDRLPADYEPLYGDVLRMADGRRFEVRRLTADKSGVELQGIDEPVVIFVKLDELKDTFVALDKTSPWRDDR